MASMEGLMPITRAFLAQYYDKYPLTPISEDVSLLSSKLRSMSNDLTKDNPISEAGSVLVNEAKSPTPHKIDHNMWKNREHVEEIIFLLERSNWPKVLQLQSTPEDNEFAAVLGELRVKLQNTLKTMEYFQSKNSENIFNTVMTYMPQDFRGKLIRLQRERSERNKQAEVDALVNVGGSIRDRYALLWRQQMERRRQLAELGAATGVYKTLVTYLVGVPEVLLEFIRQINDDQGPMEEQRQRYGPSLYSLTNIVFSIRLFIVLSWGRYDARKLQNDEISVLVEAVHIYTSEMDRYVKFMGELIANSPFFIKAKDVGASEIGSDDYKETVILAGKTHEVSLEVDAVNSYIAWDFSLLQGKMNIDIGFSVEYISPSGEKIMILPYRRYSSDQGNFSTLMAGCYKLIWDNTYSTFFKKTLRYKVDSIPPVTESSGNEVEG